jgi:rhodanese-related sulfurtransferase
MQKDKKLYLFVSFAFIVLILLTINSFSFRSSAFSTETTPQDTSISATEANEIILKNKDNRDFVVIDVRTPEEFNEGHIEGCINIDYKSENFNNEISKLQKDKTYLVYCRSGRRSKAAQEMMFNSGFNAVINLAGGFEDWKKESLPVVK